MFCKNIIILKMLAVIRGEGVFPLRHPLDKGDVFFGIGQKRRPKGFSCQASQKYDPVFFVVCKERVKTTNLQKGLKKSFTRHWYFLSLTFQ